MKINIINFIKKNIFILVITFINVINANRILGYKDETAGVVEYLLMFMGAPGKERTHLPVLLIVFIIYVTMVSINDVYKGAKHHDILEVMKKGRNSWWIKRCILCVIEILTYISTIMIAFVCAAHGRWGGKDEVARIIVKYFDDEIDYIYPGNMQFVVENLIVFVVMIIGVTLLMKLLALLTGLLVPLAVVSVMTVLSMWYVTPILPVNYMMILRNKMYLNSEGVDGKTGMLIAMIFILIAFLVGGFIAKKQDIY